MSDDGLIDKPKPATCINFVNFIVHDGGLEYISIYIFDWSTTRMFYLKIRKRKIDRKRETEEENTKGKKQIE
jgi:hypothetical protein